MLDKLRDQTGAKYPRHGVLPAILPPGARGIYGAAGAAGSGLYIPRARAGSAGAAAPLAAVNISPARLGGPPAPPAARAA